MDISIQNIWRCWYLFRKGKVKTRALEEFEYYLEANLFKLYTDLNDNSYVHGNYRRFVVFENKRREIVVASIRDRVVHRMIYEFLVPIFDKTFIYDVWSCRKGKGLLGAIERSQYFASRFANGCVWRTDIKKFFDSVDHDVLFDCIKRRVSDLSALQLIKNIVQGYWVADGKTVSVGSRMVGIPIGNLTSQIFANIYLNEFDRFVVHVLKPKSYLRYGDDVLFFEMDKKRLEKIRKMAVDFLSQQLFLTINPQNDIVIKPKQGIYFLGVDIFPGGRRLMRRNWRKINLKMNDRNFASYFGLIKQHSNHKRVKEFVWRYFGSHGYL